MTDSEFRDWIIKNKISSNAENIIRQVRNHEPFRRVQGGKGNVAGRYPSRKMGCMIQFESHKVEFPFTVFYENDDKILEYYDQPVPVKLTYHNIKGRHLGLVVTPDYFTLQSDGTAGWEECKTEEELVRLSEKAPERYRKDENGCWRSPPGEQYASQFGLYFQIRSSAEINWVFFRNLLFLQDYQREEATTPPETQTYITTIVESNQGISLLDLLHDQDGFMANDVYHLILNGELYVDLQRYPLAEPGKVPIFSSEYHSESSSYLQEPNKFHHLPSKIIVEPGAAIIWAGNPFSILTVGEGFIWVQNEFGKTNKISMSDFESMINDGDITGVPINTLIEDTVAKFLKSMSPKDHKRALKRRKKLEGFHAGTEIRKPTRSEYRWLEKYRVAEELWGCGFLGLFDRNKEKGNKSQRLSTDDWNLMDLFIETEYLVLEHPKAKTAYAKYEKTCDETGRYKASYETFRKRIKRIDAEKKAEKRKGKRSAYQLKAFYLTLTQTTPPHGDRPFEIAHIDHTELDIELLHSETLVNLGRPWLTLMIDANSRRILAFHLSFEPPSYRSCMLVLRNCGLRYKCLPQTIVVDNGKEFKSTYFELLLAMHETTKKERPPAQARFGSLIERMFGTTNTEFIHTLRGNTQIMKEVREVTKSNNPRNRAVWNLKELYEKLSEFFFETYDSCHHTGIMEKPRDAFARGLLLFGKRRIIQPSAIEGFIFSTLPTNETGEATVVKSKGVKINNIYYRDPVLDTPTIIGTKVKVKYDPYDLGHAFACVNNNWIECKSEYYAQFKDLTERELKAICAELEAKHRLNNRNARITTHNIAAFLVGAKNTENELIEQKQAQEQRGKFAFATEHPIPEHNDQTININSLIDDDTEPDDEYQILN